MDIFRHQGFARAGLVGNPSDGYNGKTISILVKDFWAEAILYEWEDLELILSQDDQSRFRSVHDLVHDVDLHGYYGGIRLVKATIKKFVEYCRGRHELHSRNFSIRYESNIPRQVGLAGSSAIIAATLRALMAFYGVEIPLHIQPSLILSVETDELRIVGGLQDRVIQVYGGLVYMDFSREAMFQDHGFWCGRYERLDPALLPPIYIAYSVEDGEPTERLHNPLRARFEAGDPAVVGAMQKFARLAAEAKTAIQTRNAARLAQLMNENFDTRRSICQLPKAHVRMVEVARGVGASAKFAGSGGAIVGTFSDEAMYADLKFALEAIGCRVLRPKIV